MYTNINIVLDSSKVKVLHAACLVDITGLYCQCIDVHITVMLQVVPSGTVLHPNVALDSEFVLIIPICKVANNKSRHINGV